MPYYFMDNPRHNFGIDVQGLDLELTDFGPWDVEKDKSSEIVIFPTTGVVDKIKDRRLNQAIYEAYSTILFNGLLKQYNELFRAKDFTLYSPQTLRIQYGVKGRNDSLRSLLKQFFCPGISLSRLNKPKRKLFKVGDEDVRVEDRVMYLTGVLSEVLLREGLMHGDPQLRHLFLLPKNASVYGLSRDGSLSSMQSRNGVGVIDVENARKVAPYSSETKSENRDLKEKVMKKYGNTPRAEEFYDKGRILVREEAEGFDSMALTELIAKETFDYLFPDSLVDKVDLEKGKVLYK